MDSEPPPKRRRYLPLARNLVLAAGVALLAVACTSSISQQTGEGEALVGYFGLYLLIAFLALALNFLFVMAQSGVAALGEVTIATINARGNYLDRILAPLLRRLPYLEQKFSAASLLMLVILAVSLAEAGMELLPGMRAAGALLGVFVALLLQLIFTEVIARGVALAHPLAVFRIIVPPCYFLALPIIPALIPGRFFGGIRPIQESPTALSDMHLRLLPSLSGVERVIQEDALEMIDSVREFAESTAEDIMTPRTEVDGIEDSTAPGEIYERLRKSEFSRLVVYKENLDKVRGTLLAKEVLLRRPQDPLALLRDPIFIDEKATLPELLRKIRDHRTHLLIVIDEYGGVSGIVTLHDLFEAIVGHIEDLEDEQEFWIEKIDETSFSINGRVEIWELNDEFDLNLDEDLARTAGGLVFNTLGRVPQEGDRVAFPGVELVVVSTSENRIQTMRLEFAGMKENVEVEHTAGEDGS
ncbi:MAG: HlyC/CorC family transporter [Candidatus Sumerlaeia bacterium]|nr:HlyC/CorC family transporter [Candidatus Sumerlaeia bacterium]